METPTPKIEDFLKREFEEFMLPRMQNIRHVRDLFSLKLAIDSKNKLQQTKQAPPAPAEEVPF